MIASQNPLTDWVQQSGSKKKLADIFKSVLNNRRRSRKDDDDTSSTGTVVAAFADRKKNQDRQKVSVNNDDEPFQLSLKEEEDYLLLLILVTCLIESEVTKGNVVGQLRAIQKGISQILKINDQECQIYKTENSPEIVSVFEGMNTWLKTVLNIEVNETIVVMALRLVESSPASHFSDVECQTSRVSSFVLFQNILKTYY